MSSEELFVQQFATLFVRYRHALTLESTGEKGNELRELGELPVVELDRMVSAARLALLEIETKAREYEDVRQYYSQGRTRRIKKSSSLGAQNSPSVTAGRTEWYRHHVCEVCLLRVSRWLAYSQLHLSDHRCSVVIDGRFRIRRHCLGRRLSLFELLFCSANLLVGGERPVRYSGACLFFDHWPGRYAIDCAGARSS